VIIEELERDRNGILSSRENTLVRQIYRRIKAVGGEDHVNRERGCRRDLLLIMITVSLTYGSGDYDPKTFAKSEKSRVRG
jgi:hypothetical protein